MKNDGLKKTASLMAALWQYTAPRGDWRIRVRIMSAFGALVASRGSNIITPLLYGAAVDMVNAESGFSLTILLVIIAGYALSRLGQQVFAELKQYLFAAVAQRAVRGAAAPRTARCATAAKRYCFSSAKTCWPRRDSA